MLITLLAAAALARPIAIDHKRVACVVAEAFSRIDARLDPAESVARARVYFRGEGDAWYFVDMKSDAGVFHGALPKPKKSLKKINYYIEAVSQGFDPSRTANFAPDVVASAAVCSEKQAVAALASVSSVVVGGPAGAPVVPVGFSAAGVSAGGVAGVAPAGAGSTGSGTAAGAAGAAGAGGGLGTTAILVGAGAAVAGGAAAVVATRKDGDGGGIVIEVTPRPLVRVPDGGSAQFSAVARDRSGSPVNPQPRFSWSSTCACTQVDQNGLATFSTRFGPGTCASIIASDPQGNQGQSYIALLGSTNPCPPSQ